jgi:hypothetical protein
MEIGRLFGLPAHPLIGGVVGLCSSACRVTQVARAQAAMAIGDRVCNLTTDQCGAIFSISEGELPRNRILRNSRYQVPLLSPKPRHIWSCP